MKLKLRSELLRTKSILNKISDASFSYSRLEKEYPVTNIQDEETAVELIEAYKQIISDVAAVIRNYESEK